MVFFCFFSTFLAYSLLYCKYFFASVSEEIHVGASPTILIKNDKYAIKQRRKLDLYLSVFQSNDLQQHE
jgi:hypothetical protein